MEDKPTPAYLLVKQTVGPCILTSVENGDISIQSNLSLFSPYYATACSEFVGPFRRHCTCWKRMFQKNVAVVAGRWQHYV